MSHIFNGSLHGGLSSNFLHREVHRFSKMHILFLFTWQHHIHSHHLVLTVDIGSCLQQSLDCLDVSLPQQLQSEEQRPYCMRI